MNAGGQRVDEPRFGAAHAGLRFGLTAPSGPFEAGGSVLLRLSCENVGDRPVDVFGFAEGYPRSLRVSPPKAHRPYIRVSFGDTRVLHPPEAFTPVLPGGRLETGLDLSFAFDRRGVGAFSLAFAYDPVRASGRLEAYTPEEETSTGKVELVVIPPESLVEAGISPERASTLDGLLLSGDAGVADALRELGQGGATYAARRLSRILSPSAESRLGWRCLDVLEQLGDAGLAAVRTAREQLPHARAAYDFAEGWLAHRLGEPVPDRHLPFLTALDRAIVDPASRGNLMLSFTPCDSDIHGTRILQILGDGERVVSGRARASLPLMSRRSTLSPQKMRTLLESIRYAAVWLWEPLRQQGIVDEPRPTLDVQLALGEPFTRHLALYQGEWRSGPGAHLFDLLERLWREAPPESMLPPAP